MKIRIPKKHVAVGIAALLMANLYQLNAVVAETVAESDTEAMTAVGTPAETETEESETESENLSSVTIVHTADEVLEEASYEVTDWWKADLDEYNDNFSLIKYEAVAGSGTTEPVDLDGDGIPDNLTGEGTAEDAVLIAQGQSSGMLVSSGQASSAVSSVANGQFAFTTYGYGHGVGLSQNGANFYAKYAGWNYQDILFHYYPGTSLMNTGTAETEIVTVKGVPGNVLMQVAEIVNLEIGPSFHEECIKAQAVAIYTYMKYYNNDSHDLKGKKNPSQKIIDACASVLGEALYYNGSYALTMFSASSGGITANCYDVFTADIPYLRSVSADYDAAYDPHYGDVTYFSVEQVRQKLQSAYGITLSPNPANWIRIIEGNGGYVNKVVIDNQITVRGNAFRAVMGLKSPKFTYICAANGDEIVEIPVETTPPPAPTEPADTTAPTAPAQTTATKQTTEKQTNDKQTTTSKQTTTVTTTTTVKETEAPESSETQAAQTAPVETPAATEAPAPTEAVPVPEETLPPVG